MSAHTKGPWSVHLKMRDCVTFVGASGQENLFLENIEGYYACQNEVDARLIAAAPDLLDALQEAKHMFAGEYPSHPTTERIFAAIAKATGESA